MRLAASNSCDRVQTLVGKPMLQPGLNERECRALGLKPGVEVLDERRGQRHVGVGELGKHMDKPLGVFLGRGEHAVGPGDRHVPLLAAARDPRGHAADVLEQSQAQHDRESPQLPKVQRIDGLVGSHERRRVVPVDATVLVRDQVEGDVVDPRGDPPKGRRSVVATHGCSRGGRCRRARAICCSIR